MVKKTLLMGMLAILFISASACTTQAPDSDAVVIAVEGTMTALASEATATPTATNAPTATASSTATPRPTNTPTSTYTPTATPTPDIYDRIPPRGDYQHGYEIIGGFDKYAGETRVAVAFTDPALLTIDLEPLDFGIVAEYYYEGTDPAPPSKVLLSVNAIYDSWRYLETDCSEFDLLLDGSFRINHKATYDNSLGTNITRERVMVELSLSEFLKIANADKVEGRVCMPIGEFVLGNKEMEALRDVASRMLPEH